MRPTNLGTFGLGEHWESVRPTNPGTFELGEHVGHEHVANCGMPPAFERSVDQLKNILIFHGS